MCSAGRMELKVMEDKKVTLKLENVSKVFAKVESDDVTHALYNVNAQMESGEFISLVGPVRLRKIHHSPPGGRPYYPDSGDGFCQWRSG